MSMSRAGGAVADSGDGMPQSAIDAGEHLAAVSRYTEAAPTVAEAACFGFRDEGGAHDLRFVSLVDIRLRLGLRHVGCGSLRARVTSRSTERLSTVRPRRRGLFGYFRGQNRVDSF